MAVGQAKTPLYAQIKAHLLGEMRAGRLSPGDRVPSEAELARQFGVSRVTSKQAMTQLAQEGVIRRSPGAGSFVARLPDVSSKGGMIGIVLPLLTAPHELEVLRGAEAEANAHGCLLMIHQSGGQQEQEARAIRHMIDAGVNGVIVWPVHGAYYNRALLELCVTGLPAVLVDRLLDGLPLPAVTSDNLEGGRLAVRHLVALGHRQIGVLSLPAGWASSVRDRLLGVGMGLAEASVATPARAWVTDLDTDSDANRGRIKAFLQDNPGITAVVAVNDTIAAAAYQAADELDRRVPDDLSIIAFGQPDPAATAGKLFCHVAQQAEAMGRHAVQLLLELIGGGQPAVCVQAAMRLVGGMTCVRVHTRGGEECQAAEL